MDLIFDTETTGFYLKDETLDHRDQPWLVQIAFLLTDGDKILNTGSFLVIPRSLISRGAELTHGISLDLTSKAGITQETAVVLFAELAQRADRLIAHNINFDFPVLHSISVRLFNQPLRTNPSATKVCTMLSSTPILKLPGRYGNYKWPKLSEAYSHLVDPKGFEGAHDAMADVMATHAVLRALEALNTPLTS